MLLVGVASEDALFDEDVEPLGQDVPANAELLLQLTRSTAQSGRCETGEMWGVRGLLYSQGP